jgi:hypothetical protein
MSGKLDSLAAGGGKKKKKKKKKNKSSSGELSSPIKELSDPFGKKPLNGGGFGSALGDVGGTDRKSNGRSIQLLRIGAKFKPYLLGLDYIDLEGTRRHKQISLELTVDSESDEVAQTVALQHKRYLNAGLVSLEQVRGVVERMIEHEVHRKSRKVSFAEAPLIKTMSPVQSAREDQSMEEYEVPRPQVLEGHEDLNKLSDAELNQKKALMEKDFEKNQVKPGDSDYQYDHRVEFKPQEGVNNEWDDSEEEESLSMSLDSSAVNTSKDKEVIEYSIPGQDDTYSEEEFEF